MLCLWLRFIDNHNVGPSNTPIANRWIASTQTTGLPQPGYFLRQYKCDQRHRIWTQATADTVSMQYSHWWRATNVGDSIQGRRRFTDVLSHRSGTCSCKQSHVTCVTHTWLHVHGARRLAGRRLRSRVSACRRAWWLTEIPVTRTQNSELRTVYLGHRSRYHASHLLWHTL